MCGNWVGLPPLVEAITIHSLAYHEYEGALINDGFAPDFEAGLRENIQQVDKHDLLAVPLDKL